MPEVHMSGSYVAPGDVPAATEPGCTHPDCVLLHPHAGPAILAVPVVEPEPAPVVVPEPEPSPVDDQAAENYYSAAQEPARGVYRAALTFTAEVGEFAAGERYEVSVDVARGLVDGGLLVQVEE